MDTRIAVLSDVHGNLPALAAVLADVTDAGVDLLVFNGDIADGPFPVETLELLQSLSHRALWIKGNGDRWLVEVFDGTFQPTGGPADDLVQWAASLLSREHRNLLHSAQMTASLEVPGLGSVGFCHATARSDNEMVLVDSTISQLRDAFADLPAQTVVIGHSHMPFDRLFQRRRLVNTGAVGMPYGHAGASWAMIADGTITLRRTGYDAAAAAELIGRTAMPDAESFGAENVRTTPSDEDALAVFGKVRDRQLAEFGDD